MTNQSKTPPTEPTYDQDKLEAHMKIVEAHMKLTSQGEKWCYEHMEEIDASFQNLMRSHREVFGDDQPI